MRVWKLTGLERPEAAYLSYAGWDLSSDMGETVSNSEPVSSSVMFISSPGIV